MVFGLERSLASDKLVESDANCPHVNHLVVTAPMEHLRSPVIGSARDGQHLPLGPTIESLLADSEIDELDVLVVAIVKYVFRFDVAMANVVRVDIGNSPDELVDDDLDLFLRERFETEQVWHRFIVHNQVTDMFAQIQVHSLVLYNIRVIQRPDSLEVVLEEQDVLFVHLHRLDCIGGAQGIIFFETLAHNAVRPFSYLVAHLVLLFELIHALDFLLFPKIEH